MRVTECSLFKPCIISSKNIIKAQKNRTQFCLYAMHGRGKKLFERQLTQTNMV